MFPECFEVNFLLVRRCNLLGAILYLLQFLTFLYRSTFFFGADNSRGNILLLMTCRRSSVKVVAETL